MDDLDLDKMNAETENYNNLLDEEIKKKLELIEIISRKQSILAQEIEKLEKLLNEK